MTKRTYNSETESVIYRAERRYANKRWGPVHLRGHYVESFSPKNVKETLKYYRKWKNWKTGKGMFDGIGRIRIVKITSKFKIHTTIIKEPQ